MKKEKGLTNAQLAKLSGVTLSTIDKITSGINKNPKLDTLLAICDVLGCSLNDFCEQKKSPNTTKLGDKEVSKIIEENYSVTTRDAFNMYTKLDTNDQAEIRGEMKHMLRSEKYSDQDDTLQDA